jgi:hypothetical protein
LHTTLKHLWKQVLDYFDAFQIGLTATPDNRTFGYFEKNIVSDYGYKKAVEDGVLVPYNGFEIETKITSVFGGLIFVHGHPYGFVFTLGLDNANRFCIHKQYVIGGADSRVVFTNRHTQTSPEVNGIFLLHDPTAALECGVNLITGKLFGVLVHQRC